MSSAPLKAVMARGSVVARMRSESAWKMFAGSAKAMSTQVSRMITRATHPSAIEPRLVDRLLVEILTIRGWQPDAIPGRLEKMGTPDSRFCGVYIHVLGKVHGVSPQTRPISGIRGPGDARHALYGKLST